MSMIQRLTAMREELVRNGWSQGRMTVKVRAVQYDALVNELRAGGVDVGATSHRPAILLFGDVQVEVGA